MPDDATAAPKSTLGMIFVYCNDLLAIRKFYSELIGMEERGFSAEHGFCTYKFSGGEMMFFASGEELPVIQEWGDQPGYQGGKLKTTSWAVDVPDSEFAAVVSRLKQAGVKTHTEYPEWRFESYRGFNVMDPMGNTAEVYSISVKKPSSTVWPRVE